jgi:hypothetical protein
MKAKNPKWPWCSEGLIGEDDGEWLNVQPTDGYVAIDSCLQPMLNPAQARGFAKAVLRAADEAEKHRRKWK